MKKFTLTALGVLGFLMITSVVYAEETLVISSPSSDTTLEYGESVLIKWKSVVPIGYGANNSPGVFRISVRDTKIGTVRHIQTVDSCTTNKGGSDVYNTYDCWLEWRPFDSYGNTTYEISIQHADTGFGSTATGKITTQTRQAAVSIRNPSHNIKVSVGDTVPIQWTTKIASPHSDSTIPYAGISLINNETKNATTLAYDIGRYDRAEDNDGYTLYFGEYNWKPDISNANNTYRFRIWHKGGALETTSDATVTVVAGTNTPPKTQPPVITPKPTTPVVSNTNTNEVVLKAQLAIYVQLLKALVQLLVVQGGIDNSTADQILAPFANY